jgi:hypothetical protein
MQLTGARSSTNFPKEFAMPASLRTLSRAMKDCRAYAESSKVLLPDDFEVDLFDDSSERDTLYILVCDVRPRSWVDPFSE